MNETEERELAARLEAVLFAAGDPVPSGIICERLCMEPEELEKTAGFLADQYLYERRGIRLVALDGAYQLVSAPQYADSVRAVLLKSRPQKLSAAGMEVLSIVAYFQPVTRVYIEQLRGIDCSRILSQLIERGLIEEAGRMAAPGRPILYRTTRDFLRVFGISSIEELPHLDKLEKEDIVMAPEDDSGKEQ